MVFRNSDSMPFFRKAVVRTGVLAIAFVALPTYAAAQTDAALSSPPTFRRFELKFGTADHAKTHLQTMLPASTQPYSVFVNPEMDRELVVVGDEATLDACTRLVAAFELAAMKRSDTLQTQENSPASGLTDTSHTGDFSQNNAPEHKTEEIWQQVSLKRTSLPEMQANLHALYDSRLSYEAVGNGIRYEIAVGDQQKLTFGWNNSTPVIHVSGPSQLVGQFARLVKQLDEPKDAQSNPRVLAYRHASAFSVESILNAYGSCFAGSNVSAGARPNAPLLSGSDSLINPETQSQEAAPLDGVSGSPQDPAQQETIVPQLPEDETQRRQDALLRELRDSVQVETLPDLGIIILRGRQKEVDELSRIIQELERLSADTQPEIRVVELEHAKSDSVQKVIQAVSADLVSGRSGRVNVTSLGKPNALLLIGWGDAIAAITELIEKLDQPVAPESQFEVFHLQYAQATATQTSINAFYQNREGLGTKAQIVADPRSNSLVAFGSPRDLAEVRRLVFELDVTNYRKKQQARVINVHNAIASELATTLQNAIKAARGADPQQSAILELLAVDPEGEQIVRSGVLDDVQITANPQNNSLFVSGPAESMDLIEALVRQLDAVGATAQIKVFRIENGDALTLVQMLRSLLPEQTIDRPPLKVTGDDDQGTSLAPLRFSVDVRTNTIIATGSESDLRIIHALLLRLDEREFSERRTTVYRLKNAPAMDVAQAINEFLRSERQVESTGIVGASPFEQLEREVVVVPEPVSNRLILSATPRFFEELETLIQELDEPPPQVVIQVMIAEVSLDDNKEFGIELGLQDSILFDRSLLGDLITTTRTTQTSTASGIVTTTEEVIQAATNTPGYDFNNFPLGNSGSAKSTSTSDSVAGQGLSHFSVGRVNNELGFGGLVLSASSESVSLLVRALEECRRLEVLSRPQIRTLDNQPAFIQVGQRVPRIIGSTVNQAGQSNVIALENVGLILGVTPRISPDGTVVMEIDAERSGLGPESEGIPVSVSPNGSIIRSPRVDTTTAQATVSAATGETIILGGLITKKKTTIRRRVPWLSDIPLLGNAFRYDGDFTERAELLIILTPYVIRDHNDEQRLQQIEFARMHWCLSDVEEIHGNLDEAYNPVNLDFDSPETQILKPGESPILVDPPGGDSPTYPDQIDQGESDQKPFEAPTTTNQFEAQRPEFESPDQTVPDAPQFDSTTNGRLQPKRRQKPTGQQLNNRD